MKKSITIKETIAIDAPRSTVWSFTQDFSLRRQWDASIIDLHVLQKKPFKFVRLKTVGGVITHLQYKLCRRPEKTSLKMVNTESWLIQGGGGSWTYDALDSNLTEWTQVNTLTFKSFLVYWVFGNLVKWRMVRTTQIAMKRAKTLIEQATH